MNASPPTTAPAAATDFTIFVQVLPGDGHTGPSVDNWLPWTRCQREHRAEVVQLAAHRHLRARGGVGTDDPPYVFTVFHYTSDDLTHPNGRPRHATATTFTARKH